ncbi:hypothetical protein RYD26_12605, partial [Pasteurellaceae bacterium LIM206]|nr:hypothetical protein [Pasteurellaceae bacterium LIM206]
TEQELIDRAITYVLEHQPGGLIDLATDESWDTKRYTTMEEFKKLNPNCCQVDSWPDDAVREDYDLQLKGKAYKYVKVKYLRTYVANREPEHWEKYIVFDNCDEIKERHELY